MGIWVLKFLKRHLGETAAGVGVLAGLISAPLLVDALHPFAIYFWTSSAFIAIAGFFVIAMAFVNSMVARFNARTQRAEQSLRNEMLRAIEQSTEQTQLAQQRADNKVTSKINELVSEISTSQGQSKEM